MCVGVASRDSVGRRGIVEGKDGHFPVAMKSRHGVRAVFAVEDCRDFLYLFWSSQFCPQPFDFVGCLVQHIAVHVAEWFPVNTIIPTVTPNEFPQLDEDVVGAGSC
jgi:hypothetical protein